MPLESPGAPVLAETSRPRFDYESAPAVSRIGADACSLCAWDVKEALHEEHKEVCTANTRP